MKNTLEIGIATREESTHLALAYILRDNSGEVLSNGTDTRATTGLELLTNIKVLFASLEQYGDLQRVTLFSDRARLGTTLSDRLIEDIGHYCPNVSVA